MGEVSCFFILIFSYFSLFFLSNLLVVASKGNLLLQYLSSKSWAFRLRFGENGGLATDFAPKIHHLSRHSCAGHLCEVARIGEEP